MKKIFVFLLFFITHYSLIITHCYSQWVQIPNGMGINRVVRTLAKSGNNILAGLHQHGVYLSSNNGTNWIQTSLNSKSVYSLATNGNDVYAGTIANGIMDTNAGIYRSTDNGINWTQIGLHILTVNSVVSNGNNIFAGAEYGLPGIEGVYLSTNNGINWALTVLNNRYINSLAILGNNIFAGTVDYGVYLSINNGQNWTETALNNKTVYSLAVNGNNIFAGTDSGVYLSTNNGTNWIQKNQGFGNNPLVISLLVTNNYVFSGVFVQSVWQRSYQEIIGIKNISSEIPKEFKLEQNYPNPFNPVTKIKFNIAAHSVGQTFMSVYDITGREIAKLVNEQLQPGTYEVTFDGTNLSSGVYFYRLTAGNFSVTKKLTLLK
jgi:hypothetical protein